MLVTIGFSSFFLIIFFLTGCGFTILVSGVTFSTVGFSITGFIVVVYVGTFGCFTGAVLFVFGLFLWID